MKCFRLTSNDSYLMAGLMSRLASILRYETPSNSRKSASAPTTPPLNTPNLVPGVTISYPRRQRFSSDLGSVQSDDGMSLAAPSVDSAFCESCDSLDDVFASPEVIADLYHDPKHQNAGTERMDLSVVPPAPKPQRSEPLYINLPSIWQHVRLLEPHPARPASVNYVYFGVDEPSRGRVAHVWLRDWDQRTDPMAEILASDAEIAATPTAEMKDRLLILRKQAEESLLAGQASLSQIRAYATYLRNRKPQSPIERDLLNAQYMDINKLIVVRHALPPGRYTWPDARSDRYFSWVQLLCMPADYEPECQERMLRGLIKTLVCQLPSPSVEDRGCITAKIALLEEKLVAVRNAQKKFGVQENL